MGRDSGPTLMVSWTSCGQGFGRRGSLVDIFLAQELLGDNPDDTAGCHEAGALYQLQFRIAL